MSWRFFVGQVVGSSTSAVTARSMVLDMVSSSTPSGRLVQGEPR